MLSHVIFAVNRLDAKAKCEELGFKFEEVTWVMNFQLLGDVDPDTLTPHFTDTFKEMPAFREAALAFDLDPESF